MQSNNCSGTSGLLGDELRHDFSFLDVDLKTKGLVQSAGHVQGMLHKLWAVCEDSTVIGILQFADLDCLHFCMGPELPDVKKDSHQDGIWKERHHCVVGHDGRSRRGQRVKRTGAKTQPCFTPTLTCNNSAWRIPVSTPACISSCSCCRMERNLGGTPSLESCFQIISHLWRGRTRRDYIHRHSRCQDENWTCRCIIPSGTSSAACAIYTVCVHQTGELRGCTVAVCALSACRKAVSDTLVCSFLAPLWRCSTLARPLKSGGPLGTGQRREGGWGSMEARLSASWKGAEPNTSKISFNILYPSLE